MVKKDKRLQVTISDKYPLMQEIIAEFRNEGKSISDYFCRLATEDHLSKTKKDTKISVEKKREKVTGSNRGDVRLPSIDMILEYMINTKMDLANEILRLHKNREISDKNVVDIYLGIWALKIQFDNTKTIKDLTQFEDKSTLIYSKRNTLSPIAIERATGHLVDRMALLKKEQDKRERAEKIKKERDEKIRQDIEIFTKKHPGKPPYLREIPDEDWDFYEHPENYEEIKDDEK